MPFFRTSGGSIMEIDLPNDRNPHAVQLHAERLAKGELTELDPATVEAYEDQGATKFRVKVAEEAPRPVRARKSGE